MKTFARLLAALLLVAGAAHADLRATSGLSSGGSFIQPILGPNSTCALPTYSWTADPALGLLNGTLGRMEFGSGGACRLSFGTTGVTSAAAGGLMWSSTADPLGTVDGGLGRNAAGIVEVNNGTACSTAANCADLVVRHYLTRGTAPSVGGAACGTTGSVAGTDSAMQITVGSGGAATTCAITFATAFTNPPICIAQNNTDRVSYSMVTTTGGLTITATAAFTAASIFHVQCTGRI